MWLYIIEQTRHGITTKSKDIDRLIWEKGLGVSVRILLITIGCTIVHNISSINNHVKFKESTYNRVIYTCRERGPEEDNSSRTRSPVAM